MYMACTCDHDHEGQEGAGGIFGRADIEQAREMGEVIGHDRLLKRKMPGAWPG